MSPTRSRVGVIATFLLVAATAGCIPEPAGPPAYEAVGPLGGRTTGSLVLRDAASTVEVRLSELPDLLYRISTPPGSGLEPRVTGPSGRVSLTLPATGGDGRDAVAITLNRAVRWDLRLPAGAGEQYLDLTGGRLTRLDLGASGLVRLRLPGPRGTVPVTLTGGIGRLEVQAPRSTPILVRLRAGAGTVSTPWTTARAPVLAPRSWPRTPDRYAIDVRGTLDDLTVR